MNLLKTIFHVVDDRSPKTEKYKLAARSWGFRLIQVDVTRLVDESEVFDAFAKALAFPTPEAQDWESLKCYLRDLSWIPGKWYVCFIEGAHHLLGNSPTAFWMLVNVLGETANAWWESRVPFLVFLTGDQTLQTFDYNWLADQVFLHKEPD